ncbi:MAG: copper amine oxidase N-terminal domain-containing protein [Defluviitaleaceae bacterium]|nr:copper amine oxidase N-terminal domain-containing protein [Defluviitaleaceae bacterium]
MFRTKVLTLALMVTFILTLTPITIFANGISVTIDGQRVIFDRQQPTIVDGRTLVPVRGVFEHLGFEVDWAGDTRTVSLARPAHQVFITIDQAQFTTIPTVAKRPMCY